MPVLEVCVDTIEGLTTAEGAGADRVELCSALSLGGLSPSYGLLKASMNRSIPVHVMIRPIAGGFRYSPEIISAMVAEIELVKELGFAGVVIGAGDETGLDYETLETLARAAKGINITLHRVVDLAPEVMPDFQRLEQMGINRVLSSGGAISALESRHTLARMVAAAPESIAIMPGAGITPENISQIAQATGAREFHSSASTKIGVASEKSIALGFSPPKHSITNATIIKKLKTALGD